MKTLEKYIFYVFIFLLPLQLRLILYGFGHQFNEWTSIYLYATDFLILAILSLWLTRTIREKGWRITEFKNIWIEVGLFLFLLVSGFSLFLAGKFWLGFYSWAKLVEFGLLFLYIKYNFGKLHDWLKFWQILVASAAVQSTIAIYQFFAQKSLGLKILAESPLGPDISGVAKIIVNGQKIVRAYGLVPHPNILAAILMAAIFGSVYLFIEKFGNFKNWQRAAWAGMMVLISIALFFTFSRAVTVLGLVILFCWLALIWYKNRESRKPITFVAILLLAVGILLSVVFLQYILARYDVVALGKSQAVSLRVFYAQTAWLLIKGSPFLGIGQGNFVWAFSQVAVFDNWIYQPVHNIYLLIAAETGILGLFAFLWFLFKIMRNIYLARKVFKDRIMLFGLLGIISFFLAVGFFDHLLWDLQQGQIIFWLFLGLLESQTLPQIKKSL
jgi:O-antigen ligase